MDRVTGRQKRTIKKQTRPSPLLMPWEVRYQHRIEDFFKPLQEPARTFQVTVSQTLSNENADDTVFHKDSENIAKNSLIIPETNSSKDCSGLEVMQQAQNQHLENCERKMCGSRIISDDGTVKPPNKTEASVQPTELPSSPTRKQEAADSGGPILEPLISLQQIPVQSEVAFNHHVKQSNMVLKTIKHPINYDLDEFFKYAFAPGKVSLKQRLMSE